MDATKGVECENRLTLGLNVNHRNQRAFTFNVSCRKEGLNDAIYFVAILSLSFWIWLLKGADTRQIENLMSLNGLQWYKKIYIYFPKYLEIRSSFRGCLNTHFLCLVLFRKIFQKNVSENVLKLKLISLAIELEIKPKIIGEPAVNVRASFSSLTLRDIHVWWQWHTHHIFTRFLGDEVPRSFRHGMMPLCSSDWSSYIEVKMKLKFQDTKYFRQNYCCSFRMNILF